MGTVVLGVGEKLGKENIDWGIESIPGVEDYSELQITFEPSRLSADAVVEAVRETMEENPHPKYSSQVDVVHVDQWPPRPD